MGVEEDLAQMTTKFNKMKRMRDTVRDENKKLKVNSALEMKKQDVYISNIKSSKEIEELKKQSDSYELYGDLMDEVCDDVYRKFCCVGQIGEGFHAKQIPPTYRITMDYIEERLKKQKNHDVKFWGFFRIIKSIKEELNGAHDENMDLKEENEKLKEDIAKMRRGLWIGADNRKTTLGELDKEIEGLKKQNQELFEELEHMKKENKEFNGYMID